VAGGRSVDDLSPRSPVTMGERRGKERPRRTPHPDAFVPLGGYRRKKGGGAGDIKGHHYTTSYPCTTEEGGKERGRERQSLHSDRQNYVKRKLESG